MIISLIVFLIGLVFGSFLNVLIYRLPLGISLLKPIGSACPHCNYKIKWYENIRKSNKAKITNIHLEKMKKWTYDKKKGVLKHDSGEFFHIEGKRITNYSSRYNCL